MPKGIYKRTKEARKNMGLAKKGQKAWNKGVKTGIPAWNKGKGCSEETKRKISETKKKQKRKMTKEQKKHLSDYNKSIGKIPPQRRGKDSNFWKGGISFEVYPVEWTQTLKRSIRERDRYICQICSKPQEDIAHDVHHIDYDKHNCDPNNLVTLCKKCHMKTNFNRKKWLTYFK